MFAHRTIATALIRVADLLAVLTLALFAYAMIKPAVQAYTYGDLKMELGLPVYILWGIALIGMASAILCAIGALLTAAASRQDESA